MVVNPVIVNALAVAGVNIPLEINNAPFTVVAAADRVPVLDPL